MARKALTAEERQTLGVFLSGVLRGTQALGMGALGYLDLYSRARDEGIGIVELVLEDSQARDSLVAALTPRLRYLSPNALGALARAVEEAQDGRRTHHARRVDQDDPG